MEERLASLEVKYSTENKNLNYQLVEAERRHHDYLEEITTLQDKIEAVKNKSLWEGQDALIEAQQRADREKGHLLDENKKIAKDLALVRINLGFIDLGTSQWTWFGQFDCSCDPRRPHLSQI
jgi:hypothetical protein